MKFLPSFGIRVLASNNRNEKRPNVEVWRVDAPDSKMCERKTVGKTYLGRSLSPASDSISGCDSEVTVGIPAVSRIITDCKRAAESNEKENASTQAGQALHPRRAGGLGSSRQSDQASFNAKNLATEEKNLISTGRGTNSSIHSKRSAYNSTQEKAQTCFQKNNFCSKPTAGSPVRFVSRSTGIEKHSSGDASGAKVDMEAKCSTCHVSQNMKQFEISPEKKLKTNLEESQGGV